jgi:threonine/homoserine/homoserine lactone efflux protein
METVAAALAVLLPLTMSPGPVGFALAAIVMSFGARAAIPFVLGVQSAAILVGIASALGLSQLFIAYPAVQMVLRYAGTAYVAWLGWKFLNARPKPGGELSGNVPGYFPGMATALLNPKFYIMVIAVFGNFLGRPGVASWLLVFSLWAGIAIASTSWTIGSALLRTMLKSERVLHIQSAAFGVMLLIVAAWMALR